MHGEFSPGNSHQPVGIEDSWGHLIVAHWLLQYRFCVQSANICSLVDRRLFTHSSLNRQADLDCFSPRERFPPGQLMPKRKAVPCSCVWSGLCEVRISANSVRRVKIFTNPRAVGWVVERDPSWCVVAIFGSSSPCFFNLLSSSWFEYFEDYGMK